MDDTSERVHQKSHLEEMILHFNEKVFDLLHGHPPKTDQSSKKQNHPDSFDYLTDLLMHTYSSILFLIYQAVHPPSMMRF